MKKIIFLVLCLISIISRGQTNIDYNNKALISALQKENFFDLSKIKEIHVEDSLIKGYKLNGKFFTVNSEKCQIKYIYTGRVFCCRAGGCSISPDLSKEGNSEFFDYFILYDASKTVKFVNIFNYRATFGQEITSKGWLKQFIGYSGNKSLQVGKNVDAISGATISVYAITLDIEIKTAVLKKIASKKTV